MKLILLDLGQNGYKLLSVPNRIADNIHYYRREFDKWLFDSTTNHGYWHDVSEAFGTFRAVAYSGDEAFPKWLNEHILDKDEEKAVCLPTLKFD